MDIEHKVVNEILSKFDTRTIVEIGSGNASRTKKLALYCKDKYNSRLISIEPNVNDTLFNIKKVYDIDFIQYPNKSLDVLDDIKSYDAIFIDGDPNWYTVYNELLTVENTLDKYPLVFICNLSYPNRRRDSYYYPEDIPEEYRHEYAKKLVISYSRNGEIKYIELEDKIDNAIYENSKQNGVLTAVEDYIKTSSLNLKYTYLDSLENIILLYDEDNIDDNEVNEIVSKYADKINESDYDRLSKFEYLIDYIEQDEYPLVELNDKLSKNNDDLDKELKRVKRTQINRLNKQLSYKDKTIEYLRLSNKWYKKLLSFVPYTYILLKTRPFKEIKDNLSLYRIIKNNEWFDIGFYLSYYGDLSSKWLKILNPQLHYVCKGFNEERLPNADYDEEFTKKELISFLKGQ